MTKRIRYNVENNVWTSKKPVTNGTESYVVTLDATNNTFKLTNASTFVVAFEGNGDSLTELKRNARLALTTLGVVFEKETRLRKLSEETSLAAKLA